MGYTFSPTRLVVALKWQSFTVFVTNDNCLCRALLLGNRNSKTRQSVILIYTASIMYGGRLGLKTPRKKERKDVTMKVEVEFF